MSKKLLTSLLILTLTVLCTPTAARAADKVAPEVIEKTIAEGLAAIWSQQKPDGSWGDFDDALNKRYFKGGLDGVALLTLEYSKVELNDDRYRKGLTHYLQLDLTQTYELTLRAMLLSQLSRRTTGKQHESYREQLKRDVKEIERAQRPDGGWSYNPQMPANAPSDFSNSQMAILAFSEAIAAGVEVSPIVMQKAQELFLKAQRDDGGWNYYREDTRNESYGSMTAAAVATLFVTRDYLSGASGCPCKGSVSPRRNALVDQAIERGVEWLTTNFDVTRNPKASSNSNWLHYWLYSAERVGMASGYKFFGTHDWYNEGASTIIRTNVMRAKGPNGLPWVCLSTMFLIKGRAPILANKLLFPGDWNLHPRDLANLVRYVGAEKERPMQFQIVNLEVPLDVWHEAPILYISAEDKIALTADQKTKLKEFTETGGTILFEASCGNRTADTWWRGLCRELWPEYELQAIAKEHPLWTADAAIKGMVPPLVGLNDGLRTFVFVSSRDISCPWSTNALTASRPLFLLGGNLYLYATDKHDIRNRFAAGLDAASDRSATKISCGKKNVLRMARLKTGDAAAPGQRYHLLEKLAATMAPGGPKLTVTADVAAADLKPAEVDLLWLTGRQELAGGDELAKAVKDYLAGGGFLLAEATMGDARFQKSFTDLAARIGLTLKSVAAGDGLLTGKIDGATGYDVTRVRFTPHLRSQRIGQSTPALEGLYLGEKLVGLYSPYDVIFSQTGYRAYGNLGYEPADARALAMNILLQAAAR